MNRILIIIVLLLIIGTFVWFNVEKEVEKLINEIEEINKTIVEVEGVNTNEQDFVGGGCGEYKEYFGYEVKIFNTCGGGLK